MKWISVAFAAAVFSIGCASQAPREPASLDQPRVQPVGQPAMMPGGFPGPNVPIGIPAQMAQNMPPSASGSSAGGSGMPPGALGLPVPADSICRRAAGIKAIATALDMIHNSQDCVVTQVDVEQVEVRYSVTVDCNESGKIVFSVPTLHTKMGCKAKTPKRVE